MKNLNKKLLAFIMVNVFIFQSFIPVLAATNINDSGTIDISGVALTDEQIQLIADELNIDVDSAIKVINSDEFSIPDNNAELVRGAGIVFVVRWLISNIPRIIRIIKIYAPYYAMGKSASALTSDLTAGISSGSSINQKIYNGVDRAIPNAPYKVKKLIANTVRVIAPF